MAYVFPDKELVAVRYQVKEGEGPSYRRVEALSLLRKIAV